MLQASLHNHGSPGKAEIAGSFGLRLGQELLCFSVLLLENQESTQAQAMQVCFNFLCSLYELRMGWFFCFFPMVGSHL